MIKKSLLLFLYIFIHLGALAHGQVEKPDAALTPVAALGDISDVEKSIIFNSLQSELSKTYQIVSQSDYARAEEKAFEELEADQCTAEQCIRKIQDILQVDRLFVLQILRDKDFTQLSLTLTRADDKLAREDTCTGCSTGDLHAKVKGLVSQIIVADLGRRPDARSLVKSLPPDAPPPVQPQLEEERAEAFPGGPGWRER